VKYVHSFLIIMALSLSVNAHAHEAVKNYNQITLQVSSSAEVENDTMIVSLYALEEGSKSVELANRVNQKINWALEKLKQYENIKVETESYSTNPVYNKNQIIAWRVQQSIKLESKDMSLMTQILAELQQQLKLSGLSFDVSRDKREQQTQLLIDQALTAYNLRATQIAKKLQRDTYKIVNMDISTSAGAGQYKYRAASAMLADAEMAPSVAPEIANGEQTLTVRVSGTIELE
jgi:predicted secreted protein